MHLHVFCMPISKPSFVGVFGIFSSMQIRLKCPLMTLLLSGIRHGYQNTCDRVVLIWLEVLLPGLDLEMSTTAT